MPQAPSLHRAVAGLGIATIVSYGGWFYGFGVLVQPISDDTGWSIGALGAAYAIGQLLAGLGATFGGRLLDDRGGRTTFAIGALVGGPLLALSSMASSVWWFGVAFGLGSGVVGATGFYHVSMAAARRLRPDRPAKAIGPLTIWGAFASPIFLPITAWLVGTSGWRTTLLTLAVTTTVGLLVAGMLAPDGRAVVADADDGQDLRFRAALGRAWGDTATRRLLVMMVCNGLGTGLVLTYQVPIMIAFGLPLATAAAVAGARGFLQLIGRVGLDRMVERAGSRRLLAATMALSVVACALFVGSGTLWVALLFALVAGAAMGAKSPLAGIHASEILPERHLGALMGAVQAAGGAATAAGPLAGGLLRDATGSYAPALVLAALGFTAAGFAIATSPASVPERVPA